MELLAWEVGLNDLFFQVLPWCRKWRGGSGLKFQCDSLLKVRSQKAVWLLKCCCNWSTARMSMPASFIVVYDKPKKIPPMRERILRYLQIRFLKDRIHGNYSQHPKFKHSLQISVGTSACALLAHKLMVNKKKKQQLCFKDMSSLKVLLLCRL